MPEELINLIYISAATKALSNDELLAILVPARKYNEEHAISGMLLYCDGHFIQVLEGPQEAVQSLFARIKEDKRHSLVQKLIDAPIEQRCFPDWTMGFHAFEYDDLAHVEGYNAFIDEFTHEGVVTKNARVAFQLLESFRKTTCKKYFP